MLILYLALYPLNIDKDAKLKTELYQMLDKIYESLDEKYQKPKNLKIVFCNDLTRTENKSTIYLVIRNRAGELYDFNTILTILIHEFTHILSPEWLIDHHTEAFKELERKLLKYASDLGYLNLNAIDVNYPCKME